MRAAQASLNEVRNELLGPGSVVPTTRLERFRWRTVLSAIALTVAAYLLIGELSGADILGTLSHANPGWFAVAVLGSAVTYLAAAENLAAFVPKRLSLIRGFGVQLATAFIGLAMQPTISRVGDNRPLLRAQGRRRGPIVANTMSAGDKRRHDGAAADRLRAAHRFRAEPLKIAPGADLLIGLAAIAGVIIILVAVPRPAPS